LWLLTGVAASSVHPSAPTSSRVELSSSIAKLLVAAPRNRTVQLVPMTTSPTAMLVSNLKSDSAPAIKLVD
jgi:hypothetical protein